MKKSFHVNTTPCYVFNMNAPIMTTKQLYKTKQKIIWSFYCLSQGMREVDLENIYKNLGFISYHEQEFGYKFRSLSCQFLPKPASHCTCHLLTVGLMTSVMTCHQPWCHLGPPMPLLLNCVQVTFILLPSRWCLSRCGTGQCLQWIFF